MNESAPGGDSAPDLKLLDARYETLRHNLLLFFRHKRVADPDALADEALFRVLRHILSGKPIRETLEKFTAGVAQHVFMESWRRPRFFPLSGLWRSQERDPFSCLVDTERDALLRFCFASIAPEDAALWTRYYSEDRVALAAELRISPNALRIRAHRAQKSMVDAGRRLLGEMNSRSRPLPDDEESK